MSTPAPLPHRLADIIEREAPDYLPALRRRALAEVAAARAALARHRITLHGDRSVKTPFQPHDVRLKRLRRLAKEAA